MSEIARKIIGRRNVAFVALIALTMLGSPTAARAAEPLEVFRGLTSGPVVDHRGLAPAALAPHIQDDEMWGESWFYMAQLDGGYYVFGFFLISNIGFGDQNCGYEFSLVAPSGAVYALRKDYKRSDLKYSKSGLDLRMEDNFVTAEGGVHHLYVSDGGLGLDLFYQPSTEGVRLGDGRVTFGAGGGRLYENTVPLPRARVSGTLTLDGKPIAVAGWGYSDVSSQNFPSNEVATTWYSLRFFHQDYQIDFLQFNTPKKYGAQPVNWLAVTDKEKVVYLARDLKLETSNEVYDADFKYRYPQSFHLTHRNGADSIEVWWTAEKTIEKLDVIHFLNPVLKSIVKAFIARPVIFRHQANVRARLNLSGVSAEPVGPGVSEVLKVE